VRTRITAALVAVLGLLAWAAASAQAQSPVRLSGEITDHSGALGGRRAPVQAAITRLYDQDRIKLYVVYVPGFSGLSPTAWVDRTAVLNGLGTRDILLGVATADRNYAVSADPNIGLSTTQLDSVSSIAIEPALRKSDWAAAAAGAADGFGAATAGRPIPAPSLAAGTSPRNPAGLTPGAAPGPAAAPVNSTGAEAAALIAAVVLLFGLVLFAGRRLSRRRGRPRGAARSGAGPPPAPATAELEAQASHALVETDDAVQTSDQELGFAIARFGEHAAAPFSAALKAARAELAAAFKLRQQLDDDIPETEPVRRSMLTEISGRCAEANRLLDEQSEAFDRLQDLEARAPQVLAEVDHHVAQQDARLSRSTETLNRLAVKYTPGAIAAASSSPAHAGDRLEFARTGLDDARQALAAGDSGQAAVFLQAAESAADQAESLLEGVDHLEAELTQASSALPAALREIDVEIDEATTLLAGRPDDRAAVVSRAQVAASTVRGQLAGGQPFDALGALRLLEQADAALDQVLASARDDRDRHVRAIAVLDQAMLVARSSITAAEDFITTRRGGVGAGARTRLAEAHRHFQQAIAFAQDNPEGAVNEAQHADALAQQARSLAEQDVAQFSYGQQGQVARGSGFGGGFGGAILGGILIDSLLGGGRGGGPGRGGGLGLGGGLGRGGFGMGGFGTPGSFGGARTRGRHSVGGRF
jgi:tetratricopeptide (TPR) repeat protein